jgi:hypothetical protein
LSQIDPETGQFFTPKTEIDSGSFQMAIQITIDGNRAQITTKPTDIKKEVLLPPEVILENSIWNPHLLEDFRDKKLETKRYKELSVIDGEIQETTVTKKGIETLKLGGKKYTALVLDTLNRKIGLKVKASLDPIGTWITPESLNVRGQKFEGTVENNVINGVFKITHKRYDGHNAPPFPPDFSDDEALKPYLKSEHLMESDDPVLKKKAEELTQDSRDAYDSSLLLRAGHR